MDNNSIELDWRLKKDRRSNKRTKKSYLERGCHNNKNRNRFKNEKRSSWGKTRTRNRKLKNNKNMDLDITIGYWDQKTPHSSGKYLLGKAVYSKEGSKLLLNNYYNGHYGNFHPNKLPYWVYTMNGEKGERDRLKKIWNKLTEKEKGIVFQQRKRNSFSTKKISFSQINTYEFYFLEKLMKKILRQRNYIHENI